tara:strand:- start:267 stop:959 length:693 start_codon:yes stop_codon:yes gene_type:complete
VFHYFHTSASDQTFQAENKSQINSRPCHQVGVYFILVPVGSSCSIIQGAIGIYAVLQLALVILWSSSNAYFKTRLSIASTVLNLLAALGLGLLSHLEHAKAIRPSFAIAAYLFVSLIFDVARVRTQWLLPRNDHVAAVLTAAVAVKSLMLLLETLGKRRILLAAYRGLSPEITSGLFSRGFFWWLNSLLANGFKNVLSTDDIFPINESLSSRKLSDDLQARWASCEFPAN